MTFSNKWDTCYKNKTYLMTKWPFSELISYVMRFSKPGKSKIRVLELGCGSGNDAIWFAKKGFNVTAVDISEKEINLAKEKSKGISNINYIIDDVHSFSTEEKFDIIYDRGCIHNIQDQVGDKSLQILFSKLHSNSSKLSDGSIKFTNTVCDLSILTIRPGQFSVRVHLTCQIK